MAKKNEKAAPKKATKTAPAKASKAAAPKATAKATKSDAKKASAKPAPKTAAPKVAASPKAPASPTLNRKTLTEALGKIKNNQAIIIGKELPASTPKGSVVVSFGKTFAVMREATTEISTLPAKIAAAVKELVATGGIFTAKVVKASGLDAADLLARLNKNSNVIVVSKGNKTTVTVKAKKADLLDLGSAFSAPAPKTTKAPAKTTAAPKTKAVKAPEKKADKKAPAKAPKAAKAPAKKSKKK